MQSFAGIELTVNTFIKNKILLDKSYEMLEILSLMS